MVHQRRKSDREAVSEDDCLCAISWLKLNMAQGFVIVDDVERRLSWTTGCAIDAFDTLLDEGLAMIDDGHKDGIRRYWFPCVSSISTPGGADT
ncbi:vacuolar protein sorting-associated protein 22 homolog 1-like [Prunus dulcis]|uniref:vacuolar protein sorting-associated protein 22 homolog 1-like n=1 Tax=Prunus dulcis TaxID=3755 RepID=UPI0014825BC1|nr:vacuolar protein sorting-associated protein 22 homolog 1-like [Prunus dulcis]